MHVNFRLAPVALVLGLLSAVVANGPALAGDDDDIAYIERGRASWYGPGFHGEETASGEKFNQNKLTAAHRKLPLGTEVTVINLKNGKEVEVEINDRGPYARGRVIDLSKAAAKKLGMTKDGTAPVRIEATAEQIKEGKAK